MNEISITMDAETAWALITLVQGEIEFDRESYNPKLDNLVKRMKSQLESFTKGDSDVDAFISVAVSHIHPDTGLVFLAEGGSEEEAYERGLDAITLSWENATIYDDTFRKNMRVMSLKSAEQAGYIRWDELTPEESEEDDNSIEAIRKRFHARTDRTSPEDAYEDKHGITHPPDIAPEHMNFTVAFVPKFLDLEDAERNDLIEAMNEIAKKYAKDDEDEELS